MNYGSNQPLPAPPTGSRELGIPTSLDRLDQSVSSLQQALEDLERRLNPVLQITGPSVVPTENKVNKAECSLIETIRRQRDAIDAMLAHVTNLVHRLEI